MTLSIEPVGGADAAVVHAVVQAAFSSRPPLDPPADALHETEESLREALAANGGLVARLDGDPVGCLLFGPGNEPLLLVRRFGVVPGAQGHGVAGALVAAAAAAARSRGHAGMRVYARVELPKSLAFWDHHGFVTCRTEGVLVEMVRLFEIRIPVPTADAAHDLGRRLASQLKAGDLVLLTGGLGAGKTTFTRGIGVGLDVRGEVTSPTFVIARVHPPNGAGPALVHVDAYRLGGIDELDDLDLDTSLDEAVTVVEWGEGLAEGLADNRLEITIVRGVGDDVSEDDPREMILQPIGARWCANDLGNL
ncbi:tRNA (adenosine(37)-N6)-threonylcarbamoyltransferase complex ATPase subunit type 1 TsaE [Nocardioides sp. Bht2]|uniref:tRNA (adenosine(37)-N6)-threonylcarbamoyltransferase complex ATPase subunit type 1 TsaE n=1 Tax=Nocardioides sp. Bht2 TaxID=3392297 RepID=UPI0039B4A28F